MADEGLKIVVSADVGSAITQVNTLTGSLNKLGATAPSATKAALALNSIKPGANQAGQALTNLGRIAQDAPFGFIGIQNNISPLLESFQRLKSETGSTSSALKALVSGLGGAAGLGLAVSVATSLLTVFADRLFTSAKAADKAAESAKKYAEAQTSTAEQYQKQVIEVESLVRIAQSDVATKGQQGDALKRLNELIPDNIGKLSALNIKTAQGIDIIRQYTKALEDQATAELLRGRAAELRVRLFDSERQAQDQIRKIEDARAEVQSRVSRGNDQATPQERQSDAFKRGSEILLKQILDYNTNINNITADLNKTRTSLTAELDQLRLGIDKNTKGALPVTIKPPKVDKTDSLKEAIANLEAYGKAVGFTNTEFQKLIDLRVKLVQRDASKLGLNSSQLAAEINAIRNSNELLDQRKSKLDAVAKSIGLLQSEKVAALNVDVQIALNDQATGALDLSQTQRQLDAAAQAANLRLPLTIALEGNVQDRIRQSVGSLPTIGLPAQLELISTNLKAQVGSINTSLATQTIPLTAEVTIDGKKALRTISTLGESMKEVLIRATADTLSALGEGIGTALAGGGFQSVFDAVLNSLSQGIVSIGKALTEYGVQLLFAQKAIQIGISNPAVAIAAGVAITALGAALRKKTQNKFAEGGIVTGPTNALIGEAGQPEVVFPLNKLNNFIKHTRGASDGAGVFIPDLRIAGSDLIVVFNREANRSGGTLRL